MVSRQSDLTDYALDQVPEAIVITDVAANIEYVNQAMVATSGYSRDELMGQNSRILQSGLTPGSRYRKLWAALGAGKPWRGFFNNRRKDGSHYIEFAVITPVRGPDGRVTHYLAVKEDITDKRRMSEDLTRYRYHLEELVTQRTVELEKARLSAEAASASASAAAIRPALASAGIASRVAAARSAGVRFTSGAHAAIGATARACLEDS